MKEDLFHLLPPGWQEDLGQIESIFKEIDQKLNLDPGYLPERKFIFRALEMTSQPKVLIVGQDPYPDPQNAMGLAFSVSDEQKKLPASLRNIFKELHEDLGTPLRANGYLKDWSDQGVILLNRTLTVSTGLTNSHIRIGWLSVTERIVKVLAGSGVIGVLWGKSAQELRGNFAEENLIESAHPSPLSAHRGFFGSRPFSKINQRLEQQGKTPINWG